MCQYWICQLIIRVRLRKRPRTGGCHCTLSSDLSQAVHQLGRQERTTPFMTLLSTFVTLLHRHSGQDDFSVGTPVAGRVRPETESLIGYFINTLVLRANAAGNPTFRELSGSRPARRPCRPSSIRNCLSTAWCRISIPPRPQPAPRVPSDVCPSEHVQR